MKIERDAVQEWDSELGPIFKKPSAVPVPDVSEVDMDEGLDCCDGSWILDGRNRGIEKVSNDGRERVE